MIPSASPELPVGFVRRKQSPKSEEYAKISIIYREAAGRVLYGRSFNPMITLKALSYFDDVPSLAKTVRLRLSAAVATVDPTKLPALKVHLPRTEGHAP